MPEARKPKQSSAIENLANDSHEERLFVKKKQIARRYDVCERTVHKMMTARVLPFHKWGRCVRFKISECDAAWERFKRESVLLKGVQQ